MSVVRVRRARWQDVEIPDAMVNVRVDEVNPYTLHININIDLSDLGDRSIVVGDVVALWCCGEGSLWIVEEVRR